MLSAAVLGGLIIWIIKDHEAVMTELRTMRDYGKAAESHSQ